MLLKPAVNRFQWEVQGLPQLGDVLGVAGPTRIPKECHAIDIPDCRSVATNLELWVPHDLRTSVMRWAQGHEGLRLPSTHLNLPIFLGRHSLQRDFPSHEYFPAHSSTENSQVECMQNAFRAPLSRMYALPRSSLFRKRFCAPRTDALYLGSSYGPRARSSVRAFFTRARLNAPHGERQECVQNAF